MPQRLLLVGHDPGMHRLAVRLAASGDAKLRERLAAKFPTAGLAQFRSHRELGRVHRHAGELLGFWRPRDLGGAGD